MGMYVGDVETVLLQLLWVSSVTTVLRTRKEDSRGKFGDSQRRADVVR